MFCRYLGLIVGYLRRFGHCLSLLGCKGVGILQIDRIIIVIHFIFAILFIIQKNDDTRVFLDLNADSVIRAVSGDHFLSVVGIDRAVNQYGQLDFFGNGRGQVNFDIDALFLVLTLRANDDDLVIGRDLAATASSAL